MVVCGMPAAIMLMCFTLGFLVIVELNRSAPQGVFLTLRVQQSELPADGLDATVEIQRARTRGLASSFAERCTTYTVEEAAQNLDALIEGYAKGSPRPDVKHANMSSLLSHVKWPPYKPAGSLTGGQILQMQRWREDNGSSFIGQLERKGYLYFTDMMTELCPCNALIFSVGRDSMIYPEVNTLGMTHYIEDNDEWMKIVKGNFEKKFKGRADGNAVQFHKVEYRTKYEQAFELLGNSSALRMLDLPETVTSRDWDIIFVDGPAGYNGTIGRMQSIHAAAAFAWRAVRSKALSMVHVFIHDTERTVELMWANAYLNDANIVQRGCPSPNGQLSHFVITANSALPRYEATL